MAVIAADQPLSPWGHRGFCHNGTIQSTPIRTHFSEKRMASELIKHVSDASFEGDV
jgi:hypothetical protein